MNTKQFLKLLVETESPSHDKAAVDRVGAIVAEEARKRGAQVEIIPNKETGDHVVARFGLRHLHRTQVQVSPRRGSGGSAATEVEASDKGGILLLCHMDTVFPLG